MKNSRSASLILLLTIFILGGCDRTIVLSSREDGPFRFQNLRYVPRLGIVYDYTQVDHAKYGVFWQTIKFPFPWWSRIDLTTRLPSDERAWLIANYRTSGPGFSIGLLHENTGAEVQTICKVDANDCGRIVRIDERRWYIPNEKYIDRPGVWWAFPGGMREAGEIFDSKTLKLQKLPLQIPAELKDRYKYSHSGAIRSIIALTPDDQGAAWLATGEGGDGSSKWGVIIAVTPPSTIRHIELPSEWLNDHAFQDNADWPGDASVDKKRALSEVPQTQQWFNQFFRWEKEATGAWAVRWLSAHQPISQAIS